MAWPKPAVASHNAVVITEIDSVIQYAIDECAGPHIVVSTLEMVLYKFCSIDTGLLALLYRFRCNTAELHRLK